MKEKVNEFFRKMKLRRYHKINTVVVDTCSLHGRDTRKIVEKAKKVIVLLAVADEMEKILNKNSNKEFQKAIRNFRKEMVKDPYSKKYVIPLFFRFFSYTDNNLILYCIFHRKSILLTQDIGLLVKAKCFKIPYYNTDLNREENVKIWEQDLLENFYPAEVEMKQVSTEQIAKKTEPILPKEEILKITQVSQVPLENPVIENYRLCEIKQISILGKNLILDVTKESKIEYLLERKDEIIEVSTFIVLHEGDFIYQIAYCKGSKIRKYQIKKVDSDKCAKIEGDYFSKTVEEIEKYELPSRVKIKAKKVFIKNSSLKLIV